MPDLQPSSAGLSTTQKFGPVTYRHTIQLRHRIGTLNVDVDFSLTKPWTILFGPSGSGKTTILRAVAGLLRPDHAKIVSTATDERGLQQVFTLVDTEAGIFLPAYKRDVRLAPQQPALFPHLTVLENLKYGMSLSSRDEDEIEASNARVRHLLSAFDISGLAHKRPSALSGGEAQRVTLARAAATGDGRMLLLDEPFAGLDLKSKQALIAHLLTRRSSRHGAQTLSVTHDVGEAYQLGAEIINIADGRVAQQGPVEVVLAEERAQLLRHLNVSAESPT